MKPDCACFLEAMLDYPLLDTRQRREFEVHLQGCTECSREFAQMQQVGSLVVETENVVPPAGFADGVMTALSTTQRAASAPVLPVLATILALLTALAMLRHEGMATFWRTAALLAGRVRHEGLTNLASWLDAALRGLAVETSRVAAFSAALDRTLLAGAAALVVVFSFIVICRVSGQDAAHSR